MILRSIAAAWGRLSLLLRVLLPAALVFLAVHPLLVYTTIKAEMEFYQTAVAGETILVLDALERQIGEQAIIGDYTFINDILRDRVGRGVFKSIEFTDSEGHRLVAQKREVESLSPAWFDHWLELPSRPVSRNVAVGGRSYGTITARLSHDEFENKIWRSALNQTWLAVAAGIAFFLSVSLIIRHSLRPLRSVHEVARKAASGDVSVRVHADEGAAPEIREAVTLFNEAAKSIDLHLRERIESLIITLAEHRKAIDSSAIVSERDVNGNMIHVNEKYCLVSGYSHDDLVGKSFHAGCLDGDLVHEIEETVRSGRIWSGELENRRRDGRNYWVDSTITPIFDEKGRIEKFIAIDLDITARKTQEHLIIEQMNILERQNGELEKAYSDLTHAQSRILHQEKMASIGQLAAGVAHEINNPVGFVMSNLGSLRKYTEKLLEFVKGQNEALASITGAGAEERERIREKIATLRNTLKIDYVAGDAINLIDESLDGAGRVKSIVQNLKNFSRIDELDYKPADINEAIENSLQVVWNEIKYKAKVNRDYGQIPMTFCNPGELNQVFANLLINASHAIENAGEIGIRTLHEQDSILITISDTGCGIPPENMKRIFEPFFTTKEVGKGTGLGLSITYDIIKKHDGDIDVSSVVGQGTTFTIRLPVKPG